MGINDEIYVAGYGAVSPAGWNARDICEGVANGALLPVQSIERPGWSQPLTIRRVPPSMSRAAILANPRLRRSSPIGQFSTVAAAEALVKADEMGTKLSGPLGIVFCTTCGCVTYSRRFWDEVLKDPTFASPLIFPETVFNAPASHISAVIGTSAANYTLIGDSGVYLQGLAKQVLF